MELTDKEREAYLTREEVPILNHARHQTEKGPDCGRRMLHNPPVCRELGPKRRNMSACSKCCEASGLVVVLLLSIDFTVVMYKTNLSALPTHRVDDEKQAAKLVFTCMPVPCRRIKLRRRLENMNNT